MVSKSHPSIAEETSCHINILLLYITGLENLGIISFVSFRVFGQWTTICMFQQAL